MAVRPYYHGANGPAGLKGIPEREIPSGHGMPCPDHRDLHSENGTSIVVQH